MPAKRVDASVDLPGWAKSEYVKDATELRMVSKADNGKVNQEQAEADMEAHFQRQFDKLAGLVKEPDQDDSDKEEEPQDYAQKYMDIGETGNKRMSTLYESTNKAVNIRASISLKMI